MKAIARRYSGGLERLPTREITAPMHQNLAVYMANGNSFLYQVDTWRIKNASYVATLVFFTRSKRINYNMNQLYPMHPISLLSIVFGFAHHCCHWHWSEQWWIL